MSRPVVRQLWPLLIVEDMGRSLEFYCEALGFEVVGKAESGGGIYWCRLELGGACLMLQQARDEEAVGEGRGRGVALYIVCDEVDRMFEELSSRGLELEPPKVAYYGMKQLFVPEPDGYSLCFESPTREWAG